MRSATPLRRLLRTAAALGAVALLAPAAGAQTPVVEFTDDVLEITPARIEAMLRGLDAEKAARPAVERENAAQLARYEAAVEAFPARIAEYDQAVAAWRRNVDAWDACVKPINDRLANGAEASADRAKMTRSAERFDDPAFKAKLETRMKDLAARMQAAQQRGDQRAMLALSDSLRVVMAPVSAAGQEGMAIAQRGQARAEAGVEEIRRTCGEDPEPNPPRSPDSPNALLPKGAYEMLEEAGAKAARLTPRQYAVLKERVGAWLALSKHGQGIAASYAFAPGELDALKSAGPSVFGHQSELANW